MILKRSNDIFFFFSHLQNNFGKINQYIILNIEENYLQNPLKNPINH